jgi:hypothetical protein
MKNLILLTLALFSFNALAFFPPVMTDTDYYRLGMPKIKRCDIYTSRSDMTKWEIRDLLKIRTLAICIDDNSFSYFEIKDLMRWGAVIHVHASRTSMDRYELSRLLDNGASVSIQAHRRSFSRWELESLISDGAKVFIFEHLCNFTRWDLEKLLDAGALVIIDLNKTRLDQYSVRKLLKAGAKLRNSH